MIASGWANILEVLIGGVRISVGVLVASANGGIAVSVGNGGSKLVVGVGVKVGAGV